MEDESEEVRAVAAMKPNVIGNASDIEAESEEELKPKEDNKDQAIDRDEMAEEEDKII